MSYFIQVPCINCGRCAAVCPVGAPASDGLQYQINQEACRWELDPHLIANAFHALPECFDWMCSWAGCPLFGLLHLAAARFLLHGVRLCSKNSPPISGPTAEISGAAPFVPPWSSCLPC